MQIYGPSQLHGPQAISSPHAPRSQPSPVVSTYSAPADEVQISDAARLVEMAQQLPEIRTERVAALREAIAGGAYETEAKLDVALSRLLDEIG